MLGGATIASSALKGDSLSHGGSVLEGASKTTVGGIPLTFLGASVYCPKKGHKMNSIVSTGNGSKTIVQGIPAASNGAGTGCGASVQGSGSKTKIG